MAKGQTIKSRVRMALEGVRAGGLPIRRVVIKPDGGVDVIIGEPTDNKTETANDLDTWMEKHHAN